MVRKLQCSILKVKVAPGRAMVWKAHLFEPIPYYKQWIYQDRLGTHVGKVGQKGVFPAEFLDKPRWSAVPMGAFERLLRRDR
jgi:hypothetical protein